MPKKKIAAVAIARGKRKPTLPCWGTLTLTSHEKKSGYIEIEYIGDKLFFRFTDHAPLPVLIRYEMVVFIKPRSKQDVMEIQRLERAASQQQQSQQQTDVPPFLQSIIEGMGGDGHVMSMRIPIHHGTINGGKFSPATEKPSSINESLVNSVFEDDKK